MDYFDRMQDRGRMGKIYQACVSFKTFAQEHTSTVVRTQEEEMLYN